MKVRILELGAREWAKKSWDRDGKKDSCLLFVVVAAVVIIVLLVHPTICFSDLQPPLQSPF